MLFAHMKSTTLASNVWKATKNTWVLAELVFDPGMWLVGGSVKTHNHGAVKVYKGSWNPLPCFRFNAELHWSGR